MSASDTSFSVSAVDPATNYELDLDTVYNLALTFLHEKAEKAFHLTFDDRIILSALNFQVKYGKYDTNKASDPGFFDFVGKRRIAQWKNLGDMSTDKAKVDYIRRIEQLCPLFRSYVEAYARNNGATVPKLHSDSEDQSTSSGHHSPSFTSFEEEALAFINQYESDIRAALNLQTREQFEQYALQQYPFDSDKRAELIAHLQDRHFHEYAAFARERYAIMKNQISKQPSQEGRPASPQFHSHVPGSAVCSISANSGPPSSEGKLDAAESKVLHTQISPSSDVNKPVPIPNGCAVTSQVASTECHSAVSSAADGQSAIDDEKFNEAGSDGEHRSGSPSLVRMASMWTRGELQEFKTGLLDSNDSIVRIGCGEVITIRVPAYPSGTSIVWEFATDDYDIGFGLYFEWELPESEHAEKATDPLTMPNPDANTTGSSSPSVTPLIDEIVPIYRRNSHQEIYCGSHVYPGLGTYLFKFDNSYSLWRSKVLYYRVYYTC